jgi:predicted PurR-regulated permease PerM
VTVAVAVVVYLGRSVLIPITLAVLLSFLLALLVNLLRRVHLDRIQCCLPYCSGLLGTQVAELAEEVPRYALTNQQELDAVQQVVLSHMTTLTRSLVRNSDHVDVAAKAKLGAVPAATPSTDF